jgi:hypothetical protein
MLLEQFFSEGKTTNNKELAAIPTSRHDAHPSNNTCSHVSHQIAIKIRRNLQKRLKPTGNPNPWCICKEAFEKIREAEKKCDDE